MPRVQVNHVEIYYQVFGKGKETILFSHGYLMNNEMFKGQIEILKDKFKCIVYDHRGHGKSEVTHTGYEMDNLVNDAISLIEKLELGSVHFIGMSTGGFIGMRIAIRRPELLKSLILMNTSAEKESMKALKKNNTLLWVVKNIGFFPVIGQVMPILFHSNFLKDKSRKSEVKKWKKIITSQKRKGIVPFGKGIFARDSVLEKLSEIKIHTGIIVGNNDVPTPPQYSKNMASIIPNAELFIIPDAGHSVAVEKPEEVTNAIRKFYNKIGLSTTKQRSVKNPKVSE